MRAEDVRAGQAVLIVARGDFYAFVDGWHGRIATDPATGTPFNAGGVRVECQRADGVKTFFVPADELALSVG